ncbi:DUF1330 domain-containing protein [Cellulosispirillum alkaliphilum]|uniref:DUF1330 domain-containing protein n=1 Tax=Cellulosispirillum alkaliphilum TaxID=3039283 RepID=UPI003D6F772F
MVTIVFPSLEIAKNWYSSDDYQNAKKNWEKVLHRYLFMQKRCVNFCRFEVNNLFV